MGLSALLRMVHATGVSLIKVWHWPISIAVHALFLSAPCCMHCSYQHAVHEGDDGSNFACLLKKTLKLLPLGKTDQHTACWHVFGAPSSSLAFALQAIIWLSSVCIFSLLLKSWCVKAVDMARKLKKMLCAMQFTNCNFQAATSHC